MPIFALQMKANLVNITDLRPSNYDQHRWYLKLKCSGCGELYPQWQYAIIQDSQTLTKGKGICQISAKCPLCGRTNTLEILSKSYASYMSENSEKFQTIVKFECRGLEPVEFDPRVGWQCVGAESGATFEDIDLNELEWADYDEKSGMPVEINEMNFKFVKE